MTGTVIRALPPAVKRKPTPLQAVADRRLLAMANRIHDALQRLRASAPPRTIARNLAQYHSPEHLVDWSALKGLAKAAVEPIEQIMLELMVGGAQTDARFAPLLTLVNPRAVQAASTEVGNMIVGISTTSADGIRSIVASSVGGDMTVTQQSRLISDIVGLDPRRAQAVANYRTSLEGIANGTSPLSDAYRALADGRFNPASGLSSSKIDTMVSRYAEKQLQDRALTIARTETMRAATLGLQTSWQEAEAAGLFNPGDAMIEWVITDDACDLCLENEDAGPIPYGDSWPNDDPPVHPNCRCTLSLVTDAGSDSVG